MVPKQPPNFSGGDASSKDSSQDWIGLFELVAETYRWSKQANLMISINCLMGEAFQLFFDPVLSRGSLSMICWWLNLRTDSLLSEYSLCRLVYSMKGTMSK